MSGDLLLEDCLSWSLEDYKSIWIYWVNIHRKKRGKRYNIKSQANSRPPSPRYCSAQPTAH